jgi:hypothetical protein
VKNIIGLEYDLTVMMETTPLVWHIIWWLYGDHYYRSNIRSGGDEKVIAAGVALDPVVMIGATFGLVML